MRTAFLFVSFVKNARVGPGHFARALMVGTALGLAACDAPPPPTEIATSAPVLSTPQPPTPLPPAYQPPARDPYLEELENQNALLRRQVAASARRAAEAERQAAHERDERDRIAMLAAEDAARADEDLRMKAQALDAERERRAIAEETLSDERARFAASPPVVVTAPLYRPAPRPIPRYVEPPPRPRYVAPPRVETPRTSPRRPDGPSTVEPPRANPRQPPGRRPDTPVSMPRPPAPPPEPMPERVREPVPEPVPEALPEPAPPAPAPDPAPPPPPPEPEPPPVPEPPPPPEPEPPPPPAPEPPPAEPSPPPPDDPDPEGRPNRSF